MRSLSFMIFFILFSMNVFGAEMQAELHLISAPVVLREGDLVEGILKVWPIENGDLGQFKQLENMVLANALFVTDVESIEISANNADVVEVKLVLIVKRSQENSSLPLNYRGNLIPIRVPPLKIEASDKDPEDYYVMDQGLIGHYLGKIIIVFILIILFLLAIWKRSSFKSLAQKLKRDPLAMAIKKNNEMFLKAGTRQEYEEVYAKRKDWLNLIKVQAPAYDEFFKTMEIHQYKRYWNAEVLNEVKSSFDVIRGSFK